MQCTLLSLFFLLFNSQLVHAQEAQVNVKNFLEYFKENEGGAQGIPNLYELSNSEITLMPDEKNKVGGVTLKNNIGLDQSFVWKGCVGLGNKTVAEVANVDGISAIFHAANANIYYPIEWAEWIIEYQPEVNGGTMTVTYKVPDIVEKVWTRSNIKTEYNAKGINAVSIAIQSSTGDYSSFHHIAFDSFTYRNVTAQLKFEDQTKVYDAQNAQYQVANDVRLVKYEDGNEQPVDFTFTSEDFVVLDDAQQTPSDVGRYRVVLSEHGKQRLAEFEKAQQLDLGDLNVYKANYQITPRKVTVQANNQKLTLKQAKECLYKNDYTAPSDEVFNQDLANQRLNVAVAYDSSVQPQNFKAGQPIQKFLCLMSVDKPCKIMK